MTPGERAVNDFEVTIGDLTQLKTVMKSIERIEGVTSVERASG
jgi:GTP pyrophosphokinase